MAFYSVDTKEFWDTCPPDFKHMQETPELGNATYFIMGERADNPATVVALWMPPGSVLPRHAHDSWRFEVIAKGSLDIGEKVLGPGDVMFSEPNSVYGPHVAGPEGCLTFEVFSNFDASHKPIFELPEGLRQFDASTREGNAEIGKMQRGLMEVARAYASGSQAEALAKLMDQAPPGE